MSQTVLHDSEQKFAWELRGHWAARRRVVLALSERCIIPRIEGYVEHVSPTGAVAYVEGWHVPLADVLAVSRPHFTETAPIPPQEPA
jgi:hypothetical protein